MYNLARHRQFSVFWEGHPSKRDLMNLLLLTAATCLALACAPPASAAFGSSDFPQVAPSSVGMEPEALQALVEVVDRMLAEDAFVGAELHVIQDRRTVLHQAFGLADREESRPVDVDSIYCIRSMTKPFVGTAIQMLLEEGALRLETKASEILPSWDTPATASVTIEQLLTHRTGLPFTTLRQPLHAYANLEAVAAEAAATKLLFPPGTDFQYSDAGSDTLGAIVTAITGKPVVDFLQERVLDPLGMTDSVTLLEPDHPALKRIPSAYSGTVGGWSRHWKPSDDPIFPLFLTSQSLYSTTSDYARFLALWMDGGRDLLSSDAVDRGLTPRSFLGQASGFQDQHYLYGQQWIVFAPSLEAPHTAFGHNGSDGTFAWAWPDRDLMVLFFTQTRGTTAGLELERAIDLLLLQGDLEGHREQLAAEAEAAAAFAPYEGLYWDEDNIRACYLVRAVDDRLTIDRPGSFSSELVATEVPGHFRMKAANRILEFEPPRNDASPAFLFPFSNRVERQTRHLPAADLPSLDSVIDDLHSAYGVEHMDQVGPIRMKGKIEVLAQGREGRVEMLFDARRSRMIAMMDDATEIVWITEDDRVFTQVNGAATTELKGSQREQALLSHPFRRLADWRNVYAHVEVLRKIEHQGNQRILVQTVSQEGSPSIKLVDPTTGLLMEDDRFEVLPMMGRIGVKVGYRDFRDVKGMKLPFLVRHEYSHQLIGEFRTVYESVETGMDAERSFQPPGMD